VTGRDAAARSVTLFAQYLSAGAKTKPPVTSAPLPLSEPCAADDSTENDAQASSAG
jgi:hypothetical protein